VCARAPFAKYLRRRRRRVLTDRRYYFNIEFVTDYVSVRLCRLLQTFSSTDRSKFRSGASLTAFYLIAAGVRGPRNFRTGHRHHHHHYHDEGGGGSRVSSACTMTCRFPVRPHHPLPTTGKPTDRNFIVRRRDEDDGGTPPLPHRRVARGRINFRETLFADVRDARARKPKS